MANENSTTTDKVYFATTTKVRIPEQEIEVTSVTENLTVMVTKGKLEGCQLVMGSGNKSFKVPVHTTLYNGSVYLKVTAEGFKKISLNNVLSKGTTAKPKDRKPKESVDLSEWLQEDSI